MKTDIEIKTFDELYEKILVHTDLLSTYLRGHLMIEFLIIKILTVKPNKYSEKIKNMQHYKLIDALHELKYINDDERNVLIEINKIRNKFAHNLTFCPFVSDIESLFKKAQNTFIEFFEGFSRGLEALLKVDEIDIYNIEIFINFFMEILYNLKCLYDANSDDIYDLNFA